MKKQILVTLDRLKYPNCGLGRYSHDFGTTLLQSSTPDLCFDFLLPKKGYAPLQKESNFLRLSNYRKLFCGYMNNYDLIHVTHQLPSFKIKTNAKIVLTIHDINQIITDDRKKALKYVKKIQKNVDTADAIVFISSFTQNFCQQHLSLPDTKIYKVIHNGINIPITTPVKPKWFSIKRKYLFSIGQLMKKKNFHTLIPFLKNIADEYELIIAGEHADQEYVDKIKAAIKNLNLEQRVHLPGSVSEEEKRFLYENCTAFVFPSLAEGFGMPIIEAMRFKKPVFSSSRSSLKEIGDQHVFFWDEFDPKYMADIFNQSIPSVDDAHLDNAYNYSSNFSWETNAEEHIELYNRLLHENHS